MIETLLGSLFGGIFRIVPEVLKMLDAKNERAHELAMLDKEMEFAKVRGEIAMREQETSMMNNELVAMAEALKEQSATAQAGGKWIAAFSALIRPGVTTWFVVLYSLLKIATMLVALQGGADWKDVLINSWTKDDMAMLMMILTFWFTGRAFMHINNGKG